MLRQKLRFIAVPKSKYSEEIAHLAWNAIAVEGGDEPGWMAAGISRPTFYSWMEKRPDFRDGVVRARAEYRESLPNSMRRLARRALVEYLRGDVVEEWEAKEDVMGPNGVETLTKVRKVRRGVPQWAIDRALGRPMDVIEALQTLAEAGYIPYSLTEITTNEIGNVRKTIYETFAGLLPESAIEQQQSGISDETAGEIRAQILGIKPDGIS